MNYVECARHNDWVKAITVIPSLIRSETSGNTIYEGQLNSGVFNEGLDLDCNLSNGKTSLSNWSKK